MATELIFLSGDARKVADCLGELDILLLEDQPLSLELAVLNFFPNHIIGVIKGCLKDGDMSGKLMRAQEQGWTYFVQPVYAQLTKRDPARRGNIYERKASEEAKTVWRIIQSRLLQSDMSQEEAKIAIHDLPMALSSSLITQADLTQGVAICRQQNKRTVYYLRGVLRKAQMQRESQMRERRQEKEQSQAVWEPDSQVSADQLQQSEQRWQHRKKGVDVLKDIRKYASES